MRLPVLGELPAAREMTTAFRGLNWTPQPAADECADMRNLTSAHFPTLAPRPARGFVRKLEKPNGLFARDKLAWVDGTDFYYDGVLRGQVADSPKRFVAMGAHLLIWPDKVRYNTVTGAMDSLEARTESAGTVTYTLCRMDGTAYEDYATGSTPPESPTDGKLWVDTRDTPHVLKQWSALRGMWVAVPTTYVKLSAAGLGVGFSAQDGVTIAGSAVEVLNGDVILQGVGEGYVIIIGVIDQTGTQETPLTVSRTVPDMDFVTEHGNRVWGCSSGAHEIYASKLGDPTNWRCYAGLSTDSYAATIGTGGEFTGAATHMGYVLFFKADVIHKVYGFKPSNFEITDVRARGVQRGSEKSLAVVNEALYYKANSDVCAYGTALPQGVSGALGARAFSDAVAAAADERYYVSMRDAAGAWHLLVRDERYGLWHREDDTHALDFARVDSTLYCLRADGWLMTLDGALGPYVDEGAYKEKRVDWLAETGDIGTLSLDRKYVTKMQLRLQVGAGALVRVWVQYDGGVWRQVERVNPGKQRMALAAIQPRRCDVMRIRLDGYGDFRLHAMSRQIEGGSEL